MTKSVSLILIENTIDRLSLPSFHPRSYPISERRIRYVHARSVLEDLYDCSYIDEIFAVDLLKRLVHAYVNGGL